MLVALALLVVGVTSFFRLGRDARTLRNTFIVGVTSGTTVTSEKRIELSVGPVSFCAVRAGLSCLPIPTEVRTALRAVRGAEVGIYRLAGGLSEVDSSALLSAADRAMAARGWDRLVEVAKDGEVVAVYVLSARELGSRLRACVAVLHEQQLVIVSGRTDLEPLIELATSRPEWKDQPRRWVHL
jgi:hypothetical protein